MQYVVIFAIKVNDSFLYVLQPEEGSCDPMSGRPSSSMGSGVLSLEEKKFLLAVERGDVASTRRFSITSQKYVLYFIKLQLILHHIINDWFLVKHRK